MTLNSQQQTAMSFNLENLEAALKIQPNISTMTAAFSNSGTNFFDNKISSLKLKTQMINFVLYFVIFLFKNTI